VRVGIGRVDRDRPPEFGNAVGKTTGPEAVRVVQAADVRLVRVELRRAALREPRAVGGVQGDAKGVGDANRNRILVWACGSFGKSATAPSQGSAA